MTRSSEDDAALDAELDAALGALPEPELPAALRERLEAVPERGRVRRFPGRSWRISAFGWAAAAAIGLFIGAQSSERESLESASVDGASSEAASHETGASPVGDASADDEDETLALAVGSFAEYEEEP